MAITARGVVVFCAAILGGFGVIGLLVTPASAGESNYLLASWLLPVTLWPAAALATALDADTPHTVRAQAAALWPAYAGIVLYAIVAGGRWLEASERSTPQSLIPIFMFVVMAVHAAVFIGGGGVLALFRKTRPAGMQICLAYPVLLGAWMAGRLIL